MNCCSHHYCCYYYYYYHYWSIADYCFHHCYYSLLTDYLTIRPIQTSMWKTKKKCLFSSSCSAHVTVYDAGGQVIAGRVRPPPTMAVETMMTTIERQWWKVVAAVMS